MNAECPICKTPLEPHDSYGRFLRHQDGKKLGDILKCPKGSECDGTCDSETFNVAGCWHTVDATGELREGHPC